ncbi:hypothetical protein [Variovorax boronicumulans]|uniref:hypothetical protein n=1 Tax=Variovorax boronicumulans TaxID=436515 RepID=UPI003392377B
MPNPKPREDSCPPQAAEPQLPAPGLDKLIDAAMHDVRNSLSAIRLGVELLHRRGDTQDLGGVLAHVDSAALRAHERAEEVADLSRLAAGRDIGISASRFSLHAVVRQTIDAVMPSRANTVYEHDRLGEGDCFGDAARIGQFVALSLEELADAAPAALLIVVCEVAGEHYRVAVHVDPRQRHDVREAPDLHEERKKATPSRVRRQVLLHGIARAHQGQVRFDLERPGCSPSIEGRFMSVRPGPRAL